MLLTFKQTATAIEKAFNSNQSQLGFKKINRASFDGLERPIMNWNIYPIGNDIEAENAYPNGFKAKLICYIEGNGTFKDMPLDDLMDNQVTKVKDLLFSDTINIEFFEFAIENAILSLNDSSKSSKENNHNVIVLSCECYYRLRE